MFASNDHAKRFLISLIRRAFWIAALYAFVFQGLYPQDTKAVPDRRKTFGTSLKKFEKKAGDESRSLRGKSGAPTAPLEDEVIRIETNLVVTDVLVVSRKGNAVAGLKQDDFRITENGVVQDMELFSGGETNKIPRSIVFIVEVGIIPSFADRSLEAAKTLVDKLAPGDRMAIVNTNIELVLDFTSDKKLLKATLQKLKSEYRAGRHGYSSLIASLNELFDPGDRKPIVIMQQYGDELAGLKPMWEWGKPYCKLGIRSFCERDFAWLDVVNEVERSRATIYTVVPGPQFVGLSKEQQISRARMYLNGYMDEIGKPGRPERQKEEFRRQWTEEEISTHVKTQESLITVTGLSGGYTNFLERPEDAEDVYGSIFRVIENRYTIGYYPKDSVRDGKKRTVKIEVKGHPDYLVMGRKSYFAPER